MKKITLILFSGFSLLALYASAEGTLLHNDCQLQVCSKVFSHRKYAEARSALLQRGYTLTQSNSDIYLKRPSYHHPLFRLKLINQISNNANDSGSGDEERLLIWEGLADSFPICKKCPNQATQLLRPEMFIKEPFVDQSLCSLQSCMDQSQCLKQPCLDQSQCLKQPMVKQAMTEQSQQCQCGNPACTCGELCQCANQAFTEQGQCAKQACVDQGQSQAQLK